jgi:hypothetical protein
VFASSYTSIYTLICVKNYKTCWCFLFIMLLYRPLVYFVPEKEIVRFMVLKFSLCVLPFWLFIQPVCRHET